MTTSRTSHGPKEQNLSDVSKLLTVLAKKLRERAAHEYYSCDDDSELESTISYAVRRTLDGIASNIEDLLLVEPDTDTIGDTPSERK